MSEPVSENARQTAQEGQRTPPARNSVSSPQRAENGLDALLDALNRRAHPYGLDSSALVDSGWKAAYLLALEVKDLLRRVELLERRFDESETDGK